MKIIRNVIGNPNKRKFRDLKPGDVFKWTKGTNSIGMKLSHSTNYTFNTINLEQTYFSTETDDTDVIWLDKAELLTNEEK